MGPAASVGIMRMVVPRVLVVANRYLRWNRGWLEESRDRTRHWDAAVAVVESSE